MILVELTEEEVIRILCNSANSTMKEDQSYRKKLMEAHELCLKSKEKLK
jgi:hypothetical protein